jgi:hypothetical protein
LLALVAMHKAVAGDRVDGRDLDASQRSEDDALCAALPDLAAGARDASGLALTYPDNAERLRAAETVGEGKLRLKRQVALLYAAQIALGEFLPYTLPAIQALNAVEAVILLEWRALDRMETIARASLSARDQIEETLLPAVRRYEEEVARAVPRLAVEAAKEVARANNCLGGLHPDPPPLPIRPEDFDPTEDHARSLPRTQLVRAAHPWIVHHREPALDHLSWMFFSRAASLYKAWTNHDATERAWAFYAAEGATFYVMEDAEPPLKGFEVWTTDSEAADRRFGVIGLAYRPTYRPFGAPALQTQNRDGLVAYAQAMIYNASPQKPSPTIGRYQPEVGWDTLNWKAPARSSNALEHPESGDSGSPRIELNWQAKLTPATSLLDAAAVSASAPFGSILKRIVPVPVSLRTH